MMAAIAEGLSIIAHADVGEHQAEIDAETAPLRDPAAYRYSIDAGEVAEVWRRGSVVGSWLVDLTADAFARSPSLDDFAGRVSDPGAVAARTAGYVVGLARVAVTAAGRFTFAVSGSHTPWAMFSALAGERWCIRCRSTTRTSPRRRTPTRRRFPSASTWCTSASVLTATRRPSCRATRCWGDRRPGGTGPSLPGAPADDITYPALARASQLLWLVTGPDKKDPLGKLLADDHSIPGGLMRAAYSLVLADAAAT